MKGQPDRTLITTASGSRYAIWRHIDSWWVRPQVVESPTARLRPDVWVPSTQPRPWPCGLGHLVSLLMVGDGSRAEATLGDMSDWRTTTPVGEIATWSPSDPWPGDPPGRDPLSVG